VSARVDRVALITGAAGQDGVYLARLLHSQGYRVVGTARPGSTAATRLAPYLSAVELTTVDVCDRDAMWELLVGVRPAEVYNLAALSSVGSSWDDAARVAEVNGRAVVGWREALNRYRDAFGNAPRFFQASTSAIFAVAAQQPLSEHSPYDPQTPYGAAKLVAHEATVAARESDGLFACNGILFNHESPLRPASFVTRRITNAAAAISSGPATELALGNLAVSRDWGAALDHVRAMWLMLQQDRADDYVVATGVESSLREVVELAFGFVGVDDPWRHVHADPRRLRPVDAPRSVGDPSRAREVLGWVATTSLSELIRQMVAVDLERLRRGVEESSDYLSARA
jgi:GDPmannose 4,6-dehydratase